MMDIDTFSDYEGDHKTSSAVERQLIIIGEALNNLKRTNPEIDIPAVHSIIGFRNRIVHAYDSIDNSIVWAILKKHLIPLKQKVDEQLN